MTNLRSRHRDKYRALNLVYGFYDLSLTPSARAFDRRLVFNGAELEWFARQLEPDAEARARGDVSPLKADLPADLPPALFSVGTDDALLDDTLLMSQRWADAGGTTDLVVYAGAAHGLGHFGPHEHTDEGAALNANVDRFLRKNLRVETS